MGTWLDADDLRPGDRVEWDGQVVTIRELRGLVQLDEGLGVGFFTTDPYVPEIAYPYDEPVRIVRG